MGFEVLHNYEVTCDHEGCDKSMRYDKTTRQIFSYWLEDHEWYVDIPNDVTLCPEHNHERNNKETND